MTTQKIPNGVKEQVKEIVDHPRQPFVDWINRTVEQSSPLTREELKDDCSIFLVPEQASIVLVPEQMLAYIRPLKPRLFEMELESWNRNRSAWLPERTEAPFDTWFELHAHSEVLDLVDGPILKRHGWHDLTLAVYEACLGTGIYEGFLQKKYKKLRSRRDLTPGRPPAWAARSIARRSDDPQK